MPAEALTWLTYAGLGVFVGFFSGLLGIGGGTMIVPTLGLVFVAFGFPPGLVMELVSIQDQIVKLLKHILIQLKIQEKYLTLQKS